jgi:glycosyltransferase involved in cell wall biosynthesis
MRSTFIFPSSLRSYGGVSNWAREIIPRLSLRGIETSVLASTDIDGVRKDETVSQLEKAKISYRELRTHGLPHWTYVRPFKTESMRIIAEELEASDIAYTQNIFLGQDAQLRKAMLASGKKLIVGYHTPITNGHVAHDLIVNVSLIRSWRRFPAHHVLTKRQGDYLGARGYKNIHLIPNGVDCKKYPYGHLWEENKFKILFLGRLIEQKGLNALLECAIETEAKGFSEIQFIIAGGGPLRSKMEDVSRRHGNIIFKGMVTDAEKKELYQECQCFILPSIAEGLPLTILEAMSCGQYIISSSDYGLLPLSNSVLDDVGPKSITSAVIRSYNLWKSAPEYQDTCMKNRKVAEGYDWDIITEQFIKMFRGHPTINAEDAASPQGLRAKER